MDELSKSNLHSILDSWAVFEEMWPSYWIKVCLLKDDLGWVVQFLHVSGRYDSTVPLRPAKVTREDAVHIASRPADLHEVRGLVVALAAGCEGEVAGLGPVRFPSGGRVQYAPWLWSHAGWAGKDVGETSTLTVLTVEWNAGQRSELLGGMKNRLNELATEIGYSSFGNLCHHLIGSEVDENTAPSLNLVLPLALHVEDRDIARGKLRIECRPPLQSSHLKVFLTEDERWSDDLVPIKLVSDGVTNGWDLVRAHFDPTTLGPKSVAWVQYDGSPRIPRVIRLPVGRTERSVSSKLVQLLYADSLSSALNGTGEQLEIAMLNGLASLGVTVFYTGVRGAQLEGVDIIAIDHVDKRVATIEVTKQNYRTALSDKRPVIVRAADKVRDLMQVDWQVYGVLALGTEGDKIDSVHRQDLADANVVLMDLEDILWLATPEATATEFWSRIASRSRPWYFLKH